MPKKNISSIELAALINELQILVKGKVSQIYHQEKKELLFQLHAPGKGKRLVKIVPGKYLCFTNKKETPTRPSGFCMLLRKYLSNAFIKKIYQKEAERIVVFELEKQEKFYLIIELFSKGNLILTDKDHLIIGTLEWQKWKDRVVKPKETYIFPKPGFDWKKVNQKILLEILSKSEKRNLATTLATEINLGGLYAEEVCKLNEINFKKLPSETTKEEIKLIIDSINNILKKIEKPTGFIYGEDITPFKLVDKEVKEEKKSYSEAIDIMNPFKITSPYERKINSLHKMIFDQEEAISKQEENIDLNTKKGELVYEKYSQLQKLLDIVTSLRKKLTWNEVSDELKKEKKIKNIDLKNKKINLEL